jgi:hypothetical protein
MASLLPWGHHTPVARRLLRRHLCHLRLRLLLLRVLLLRLLLLLGVLLGLLLLRVLLLVLLRATVGPRAVWAGGGRNLLLCAMCGACVSGREGRGWACRLGWLCGIRCSTGRCRVGGGGHTYSYSIYTHAHDSSLHARPCMHAGMRYMHAAAAAAAAALI